MSQTKSLRTQFRNLLFGSIGLLVLVYSVLLYQLFFQGLSGATHRFMTIQAKYYADQYAKNPDFVLPDSVEFSVYIGRENLPTELKELFKNKPLRNFIIAIYNGGQMLKFTTPEKFFLILPHPIINSDKQLLLVHKTRPPRIHRGMQGPGRGMPDAIQFNLNTALIIAALLSIGIMFWLARRLIKQVLTPLHHLADMASKIDENKPDTYFPAMQDETEIGLVANTLHDTLQRIHQFHQREKYFLQNASHELRTPIAVISTSLDVIDRRKQLGKKKDMSDQLTNIRNANRSMREMTEALLWLGRDNQATPQEQEINLIEMIESIAKDLGYLLEGREVKVELPKPNGSLQKLVGPLCRIVLTNIIRNAFEHTYTGIIDIQVQDNKVTITDTGEGIDTIKANTLFERGEGDGSSFGLGLHIVKQIADRQSWKVQVSPNTEGGCIITIDFRNDPETIN